MSEWEQPDEHALVSITRDLLMALGEDPTHQGS